jgi:hypothetical protein
LAQILGFGVPGFVWPKEGPRVHFFDNLDAGTLDTAFRNLDLRTNAAYVGRILQ